MYFPLGPVDETIQYQNSAISLSPEVYNNQPLTHIQLFSHLVSISPVKASIRKLSVCVSEPGGAFVPESEGGAEEQSALHPGSAAGHLPTPAHHSVSIRGQNGNPRGERVFPCGHGELDQQDQADHESF